MLETRALCKEYQGHLVVNNLNLQVRSGEIYGFLGPNGAGKSTTIKMILDLLPATSGEIKIFGQSLRENYFKLKQKIGVVGEFQNLYPEMTGLEYLSFFEDLFGISAKKQRVNQLLERLDLYQQRRLPLRAYSKGMQQKIALARALLHDPEIIILDEPVSSLDPHGIKLVRDIIISENQAGKTIFISSHLLSEIEKTCHRIGIIHHGRLMAEDTIPGVIQKIASGMEIELELEKITPGLVNNLKLLSFVAFVQVVEESRLLIRTHGPDDYRPGLMKFLNSEGCSVLGLQKRPMSLEEAFVTITDNNISLLTTREG